jgi:hypothetical protein
MALQADALICFDPESLDEIVITFGQVLVPTPWADSADQDHEWDVGTSLEVTPGPGVREKRNQSLLGPVFPGGEPFEPQGTSMTGAGWFRIAMSTAQKVIP